MKKNTLGRKTLVIGLIVLFLSTTLVPSIGSLPNEKKTMEKKVCSDGFILNGTMGQNAWYISPVLITFVGGNRSYIKIDTGVWFEYTTPFVVDAEGVHDVLGYYIDQWGNQSVIFSVTFKIDMTPPTVTLTKHRMGLFKYTFIINVSGDVVLIEFYLDDVLMGNVTSPPWEFVMDVWYGDTVKVIAYDAAGLNGSVTGNASYPLLNGQNPIISDSPILPPIDRTYFFGKIHNMTIDGNDYHFESYNIREIGFWRYSVRSWGFSFDHYVGHYSCSWGGAEFHGIFKPTFICGYFTYLH
ncbi:MAG TPA: hypothetical protein DSN98_03860 [Thermoplasmata archaeon]|jgi:hypothetical protein|nr:MAG TPA: hypothetical protein DSN98_03860 [Thermoplasmata archaeon]